MIRAGVVIGYDAARLAADLLGEVRSGALRLDLDWTMSRSDWTEAVDIAAGAIAALGPCPAEAAAWLREAELAALRTFDALLPRFPSPLRGTASEPAQEVCVGSGQRIRSIDPRRWWPM